MSFPPTKPSIFPPTSGTFTSTATFRSSRDPLAPSCNREVPDRVTGAPGMEPTTVPSAAPAEIALHFSVRTICRSPR
ncbi:Uncharacterised protein [Mycobacteroides abscessus subsp. abscessus]|nr:Uncharacterised protein [Mycobacteroides abscessus subsp. abscessus]